MSRNLMTTLLLGLLALVAAKECCNGKPCGDSCISMKNTCRKGFGTAKCKLGGSCACEAAGKKAWEAWGAPGWEPGKTTTTPPSTASVPPSTPPPTQFPRNFRDALEPLVGEANDDPWMAALYRCFREGGSFTKCLSGAAGSLKSDL